MSPDDFVLFVIDSIDLSQSSPFFLVDIFFLFNLGNITTAKKTIDPNRYLRKMTSFSALLFKK